MFTFDKLLKNVNRFTKIETKGLLIILRPLFLFVVSVLAILSSIVEKTMFMNTYIAIIIIITVYIIFIGILKWASEDKDNFEALKNSKIVLVTISIILYLLSALIIIFL